MARRVVVVGAGIAGLATAYRLAQTSNGHPLEVTVLEAADAAGGKLRTGELAGIPIEEGADSFVVRKPEALDLCAELGLGDDLVSPAPGPAQVWTRRGLLPYPSPSAFGVPADVESILRWRGLSLAGRTRALRDLLAPARRGDADESIASLASRRLGPEAAAVLVGPLLAGITAGDPARIGVAATFPELAAWERGHGSLIRGARASTRAAGREGAPGPLFATIWSGLSRLVDTLAIRLGPERLRLGAPVASVIRRHGRLAVLAGEEHRADAVVLATPAFESARLLAEVAPEASAGLAAIRHVSTAVVSLVYGPDTLGRLPAGSGFIVPPGARGPGGRAFAITAATFVSSKWPRREHAGRAVVRCFVGRDGDEGALALDDAELANAVAGDLEAACGIGAGPAATRVSRWNRAMPQYEVGHLDRLAGIEASLAAAPGVFVTGSGYRGVGIADCVRQAAETAERVRAHLAAPRGPARPANGRSDVEQEAIS
jgi:protoporphyrinogen/coproporphyrinogen III oxidase